MPDRGFAKGLVVMVDATPKVVTRKQIKAKVSAGECLLCKQQIWKRGLCKTHYSRYRVARAERPEDERVMFDAKQIRAGKLLPSRQGQHAQIVNEFRS